MNLLTIGEQEAVADRLRARIERNRFVRNLILLLVELGSAVLLLMRG